MKILRKIYKQNHNFLKESIDTNISEHEILSSGSIKKKLITSMKGRVYFKIGYKKRVKC